MKRPQRPEPRTLVGQPPPQRPNEHLPDAFPDRERDRYASRALAYVILLNGAAALILVTALAFAPQSASDPRRLTWAMLVFGSGALAGLLSSLLAYIGRGRFAATRSSLLLPLAPSSAPMPRFNRSLRRRAFIAVFPLRDLILIGIQIPQFASA